MKYLVIFALFFGGCPPDGKAPEETWHDRYIKDNCKRCPECCVEYLHNEEDEPTGLNAWSLEY